MGCQVIGASLLMTKRKPNLQARLKLINSQRGVALVAFIFFIALIATAYLVQNFNISQLKNKQNRLTSQALADAKQALLAYATDNITVAFIAPPLMRCVDKDANGMINTADSPYTPENCNCGNNCPRPGDLPCADTDNNGESKTACGGGESNRLGRLPWKTLGIDDLRDGTGERLWYALSNQYKYNPRIPSNSQTNGAISLKNIDGSITNNALNNNGIVAVIIAVQAPVTRHELNGSKSMQIRSLANINDPAQYLEVAKNEDNADFAENTANGFISGIYKEIINNQPVIISNDITLPIYKSEVASLSKTIVLNEVAKALLSDSPNLPAPSQDNDTSCHGHVKINDGNCMADTGSKKGYIPVSQGNDSSFTGWQTKNINSILRGDDANNWFQQNGWRNLVKYEKNLPCSVGEKWCKKINTETTIRID